MFATVNLKLGRNAEAGFSLMEVTISLGIVGLVAIPLIGMLSVGLTSNRSSADRAVVSQIVDQMGREVEQSNFSSLPTVFPAAWFDEQGVRVDDDDPVRVFTSRVQVHKGAEMPVSGGVLATPGLARVLVDVAPNPGGLPVAELFEEDPAGGLSNPDAKRFTLMVSQNE